MVIHYVNYNLYIQYKDMCPIIVFYFDDTLQLCQEIQKRIEIVDKHDSTIQFMGIYWYSNKMMSSLTKHHILDVYIYDKANITQLINNPSIKDIEMMAKIVSAKNNILTLMFLKSLKPEQLKECFLHKPRNPANISSWFKYKDYIKSKLNFYDNYEINNNHEDKINSIKKKRNDKDSSCENKISLIRVKTKFRIPSFNSVESHKSTLIGHRSDSTPISKTTLLSPNIKTIKKRRLNRRINTRPIIKSIKLANGDNLDLTFVPLAKGTITEEQRRNIVAERLKNK